MRFRLTDIAPFIMLILTGITGAVSSSDLYNEYAIYLPDNVGYSLLACYILLKRVYNHPKYCDSTRIAVYGLMLMNVVSLLTIRTDFYNRLHDTAIAFVVMIVVFYLYIKE